jgi:CheY-like chemotaxis protein
VPARHSVAFSNPSIAFYFLTEMAHILVIAESDAAASAIDKALTERGHLVTTATDFHHLEATRTGLLFDLVILGLNIRSKVKEAILLQVKEYCPTVPVLDMSLPEAFAADADFSLMSDSVDALSDAATFILRRHRKTG